MQGPMPNLLYMLADIKRIFAKGHLPHATHHAWREWPRYGAAFEFSSSRMLSLAPAPSSEPRNRQCSCRNERAIAPEGHCGLTETELAAESQAGLIRMSSSLYIVSLDSIILLQCMSIRNALPSLLSDLRPPAAAQAATTGPSWCGIFSWRYQKTKMMPVAMMYAEVK